MVEGLRSQGKGPKWWCYERGKEKQRAITRPLPFGSLQWKVWREREKQPQQKCLRPCAAASDHSLTTSKPCRLSLPRSSAALPPLLPDAHHPLLPFATSLLPFPSSTSRSFSFFLFFSFLSFLSSIVLISLFFFLLTPFGFWEGKIFELTDVGALFFLWRRGLSFTIRQPNPGFFISLFLFFYLFYFLIFHHFRKWHCQCSVDV